MSSNNRVQKAKLNSIISLLTQFLQILIGFVVRKLFINYLGVAYLGYNSVFLNILQMLNLADMGIGVAITSYLYAPLADEDQDRIVAIMAIYKKIYSILGVVVLLVGLVISVFLGKLIPDANCGIWYLRMLFYINLIGTVSTYFLAYNRTLLIADQKSYLSSVYDTGISFCVSILQIASLIFWPNYIVYLCLNIAKNIVSNIVVSVQVNKEYEYLNNVIDKELVNEYKPKIFQYVKDVFVSRIGAVVYYSTDNIILSIIKGSLLTGFLSNYTMITGYLNTIVSQVLSSLQATFGNYVSTTKDNEAKMRMTDNYFCVNFCIGNFCFICFALLAQPFVKIFFGESMLLAFSTVLWLGINLMLTFLIQLPSQVFVIYKLFRYDRPIIITSAILNIVISVAFVNVIGVNGVLVGTFVTSLVYLFSRFYIISRYVYEVRYSHYIKKIMSYALVSVTSFAVTNCAVRDMNGDSVINFAFRAIFVGCLSILSTSFLLCFTEEFEFLKNKLLPSKFRKYINKVVIGVECCCLVLIAQVFTGIDSADFSTNGNKSYARNDAYDIEEVTGNQIFSLSFDDTVFLFEDLLENNRESIFENITLSWFKELHDKYGVVISCYVYYEDGDFNLSQFPPTYRKQFEENSSWLRFGFHTINGETDYKSGVIVEDYKKTINELERIVGSESIDNVIRLQMFQGSYKEIKKLAELDSEPIVGLLTADDNRQSYYLSEEVNDYIYSHDTYFDRDLDITLYSTDFRTEYVDNINKKLKELSEPSWNNQTGDLVVFSHEWALSMENKAKLEKVCKYAKDNGYRFVFFEDNLSR